MVSMGDCGVRLHRLVVPGRASVGTCRNCHRLDRIILDSSLTGSLVCWEAYTTWTWAHNCKSLEVHACVPPSGLRNLTPFRWLVGFARYVQLHCCSRANHDYNVRVQCFIPSCSSLVVS